MESKRLEKLKGVVNDYEETVKWIEKISIDEKTSVEDRCVIDMAHKEVNALKQSMRRRLLNDDDDDDDDIINTYRLIAQNELSHICDKVSNLTIKQACAKQISEFKMDRHFIGSAAADDDQISEFKMDKHFTATPSADADAADADADADADDDQLPNKDVKNVIVSNSKSIRRRNKRKKKQIARHEKNIAYLRKLAEFDEIESLTKLAKLEAVDYNQTILLIEEILKTHKTLLNDDEICIINIAYSAISGVKRDVNGCFGYERSIKMAEGVSVIKRYRLQVEKKLQLVCKWMSNEMIKEIFLRHLDEFKKGPKPGIKPVVIPYTRNPSHIEELEIQKKKESADIIAKEKENKYGYHDHSKCIEEQEERYYPRFVRIGDWDPISEGGIDLLYAPGRDSKKIKETFKAEYEEWREEFNIQDTSPESSLEEQELENFIVDD